MKEDLVQAPSPSQIAIGSAVTLAWQVASSSYFHLFVGQLYAGSVMRVVPEKWREIGLAEGTPAFMHNSRLESTPWRAWFMSDEDGEPLGFFETPQQAQQAVSDHVVRSLTAGHGPGTTRVA